MTEWIMYLGEVVWRMSNHPEKLEEQKRDERFYFRTYGLATLFVFLLGILWWAMTNASTLANFIVITDLSIGTEQIHMQFFIRLLIAVFVGSPLILCALLGTALLVGLFTLALRVAWTKSRRKNRKVSNAPKDAEIK